MLMAFVCSQITGLVWTGTWSLDDDVDVISNGNRTEWSPIRSR